MTDVGLILFGVRFLHSAMLGIASVEMTLSEIVAVHYRQRRRVDFFADMKAD